MAVQQQLRVFPATALTPGYPLGAAIRNSALTEIDYDELLEPSAGALTLPHVPEWSRPVYHLYVVETKKPQQRDVLLKYLNDAGIDSCR